MECQRERAELHSELAATASTPAGQYLTAVFGRHASAEPVGTLALQNAGLKCTLHGLTLSVGVSKKDLRLPAEIRKGADYRCLETAWQAAKKGLFSWPTCWLAENLSTGQMAFLGLLSGAGLLPQPPRHP